MKSRFKDIKVSLIRFPKFGICLFRKNFAYNKVDCAKKMILYTWKDVYMTELAYWKVSTLRLWNGYILANRIDDIIPCGLGLTCQLKIDYNSCTIAKKERYIVAFYLRQVT